MASVLAKKFVSLLLFFSNLFRRVLCFLGRRRRNSGMILPMTLAPTSLDTSLNHTQSVPSSVAEPFVMESWDHWGDEPRSNNPVPTADTMNQNGVYQEEEEVEPDYFSDMTPKFKKPTRIMIKKHVEEDRRTNRLNLNADLTYKDPSLGTWDEGENAWDGDMDDDLGSQADIVIREKRRQERERRLAEHQKKKMDKEVQRTHPRDARLGVRLS